MNIKQGIKVKIVLKQDQKSGKLIIRLRSCFLI
ncbi:MAG: DUF2196 domain-containing protein [Candidatus Omnitrophica bacterium]|nr:DUF2196 domain-containing protein [Candidatus Omnitrophota bacterium]